jgi:hypothetical protein
MKLLSRGLCAATVALAVTAAPAVADTVTVRIEGDGVRLERTVQVPTTGTFGPDDCPYDTAGGAIDVATGQNWDRKAFTQTILGETHAFAQNDYWEFWFNRSYSASEGICTQAIQDGDEVLMIVQRATASFEPTVFPLFITEAPQTAERGGSGRVRVMEHRYSGSTTTPQPAAGASVGGATTDADGRATVTFPAAGTAELRATAPQRAGSNTARVTVTEPAQQGGASSTATSTSSSGAVAADRSAPALAVSGLRNGQVFRRGRAPRTLRGTVADASSLLFVKLRLVRRVGERCWSFSSRRERFVRSGCRGWFFGIGDEARWDYQLPGQLPPGSYTLSVRAVDRAINRSPVRQVRFRVR